MKRTILKSLTFILTATILISCSEEAPVQTPIGERNPLLQIPADMGGINFGGVVLPNGTTSEVSEDGSTLNVKLPEGIIYIASFNNELLAADEGGYTCTSTCAGGCDVVKLGDNVGCSACPEGSTASCVGKHENSGLYGIGQGSGGGFIDLSQGISFVTPDDEKLGNFQSPVWEVLIQYPEVQEKLLAFVNELWPDETINYDKSKLVLTNVYGTYVRMHVPNSLMNARAENELIAGDEVSCDCTSGGTGCVHEEVRAGVGSLSKKIGDKCVAGACESCSMTW